MSARPSAFAAGLRLRCPECGKGDVFKGYLKLAPRCAVCGADFARADSGDGPAVFVILIVGAIVAPLLIVFQFALHLPGWLALTLTLGAAIALCLAFLPPFKAVLFALQWKHKASEAGGRDVE
jgi:uncharacterized protein (DUF983 family)